MNKKRLMKKNKPLFFLIILLSLSIIGGTISFFARNISYANKFDIAKYNVVIEEEFYDDFGTKKVNFVNKGTSDVIIRINYNEIWQRFVDDENISLNNIVDNTNLVNKEWTNEFLNNFTYYDGWYYYNKILKSNKSVEVLTEISLNKEVLNNSEKKEEYLNADYELDFNLESIQASENAIKKIWGLEPIIVGDNITWNF